MTFSELWAVVNNAGIAGSGEIEWTSNSVCQETLEVNTLGAYKVTQTFLPLLRKSGGRVVVMSSFLGKIVITLFEFYLYLCLSYVW